MNDNDPRWWLNQPPCPKCHQSHVLIDCAKRLPFEAGVART